MVVLNSFEGVSRALRNSFQACHLSGPASSLSSRMGSRASGVSQSEASVMNGWSGYVGYLGSRVRVQRDGDIVTFPSLGELDSRKLV